MATQGKSKRWDDPLRLDEFSESIRLGCSFSSRASNMNTYCGRLVESLRALSFFSEAAPQTDK